MIKFAHNLNLQNVDLVFCVLSWLSKQEGNPVLVVQRKTTIEYWFWVNICIT